MESDPEDSKSQLTPNHEPLTKKKKKKHRDRVPQPPSSPPPSPSVQATVQVFHETQHKAPPFVGYFPSGFNPSKNYSKNKSREAENNNGSPSVKFYRSQERPKRVQVVVSPSGSKVDFVGTSYEGEATAGQQCRYALGVFDKETQTLKIVPIACDKIFRLEPKVEVPDTANAKAELTPQQKADGMTELEIIYGTKRARNERRKKQAMNQEDDSKSQKDLDVKIKEVKINKEALESTDAHTARNIPPYDASATTPQEAYPLDKIILKGEWDFLVDIFELLQIGEEVAPSAYPTFVLNRIHKVGEIQDEVEKKTLSCIFSYITHLVKFKDLHSMDGVSSAKGHRFPSILRQKFSTMFADTMSKWLSTEKINLLIGYVLVLTLYADEFRTDPTDIAKDLRMSSIKLRDHFENLGCKLSRGKTTQFFILPLPIQFPTIRQKRRR